MKCPACHGYRLDPSHAVQRADNSVQRTRECKDCGARFVTVESFERRLPRIVVNPKRSAA